MDASTAREILTFSKSHEGYEAPIPEDDVVLVSEAEQLVQHAAIAWNRNNARGPEVAGVLRLADVTFDGTGDFQPALSPVEAPQTPQEPPMAETPAEAPQAPQATPQAPQTPDEEFLTRQEPWQDYDGDTVQVVIDALDAAKIEAEAASIFHHVWAYESANKKRERVLDRLAAIAAEFNGGPTTERMEAPVPDTPAAPPPQPPSVDGDGKPPKREDSPPPEKGIDYSDLIAEVEAEILRDRLQTPEPPTEAAPVLPYDFSRVADKEIRELHGAFGAFAYFADTRVLRHEAIAARCRQQADDIVRELLLAVAQYDDKNHERRMTFITAEVESSPHALALRSIQRRHEIFAEAARRERDGYHKLVETLSRQESMRHNEWLRAQK